MEIWGCYSHPRVGITLVVLPLHRSPLFSSDLVFSFSHRVALCSSSSSLRVLPLRRRSPEVSSVVASSSGHLVSFSNLVFRFRIECTSWSKLRSFSPLVLVLESVLLEELDITLRAVWRTSSN
ncbi:hypothetical protein RND81_13G154000 [Saponaria officinalis]|uniref:Uncharacterized protein n=1 Tax=Saponaria officinalis TaxID=3572 RepID=A0AAW1H108_SAPOF